MVATSLGPTVVVAGGRTVPMELPTCPIAASNLSLIGDLVSEPLTSHAATAEDWDLPSARGGASDPVSKDAAKIAKDVRAITDDCAQLQRDALEMMQEAKADLGGSG